MDKDPVNSGERNPQADQERVSTFVEFATRRLHGIESRTQPGQVASEVLRLNDAVRRGAHGRIEFRQHPQDIAAVLIANADATNAHATEAHATEARGAPGDETAVAPPLLGSVRAGGKAMCAVVPTPAALVMVSVPPCSSTSALLSGRPSPVPS